MDEAEFLRKVDEAGDLPMLPTVAARIIEMVRDPRTSVDDVAGEVERDQAISAKFLRLVNSAYYGFPRKIDSVHKAVVILGFRKVRDLVLTVQVLAKFSQADPAAFALPAFWRHSLTAAIAAEAVARARHYPHPEDAYLSGLLHDIGKLALVLLFPADFRKVSALLTADPQKLPFEAELECLGCTHARIGKWLSMKWNFPPSLVAAIELHHVPSRAQGHVDLAGIVHLGDIFARATGIGALPWDKVPPLDAAAWHGMAMGIPELDACYAETVDGIVRAREFFDLVGGRT